MAGAVLINVDATSGGRPLFEKRIAKLSTEAGISRQTRQPVIRAAHLANVDSLNLIRIGGQAEVLDNGQELAQAHPRVQRHGGLLVPGVFGLQAVEQAKLVRVLREFGEHPGDHEAALPTGIELEHGAEQRAGA